VLVVVEVVIELVVVDMVVVVVLVQSGPLPMKLSSKS